MLNMNLFHVLRVEEKEKKVKKMLFIYLFFGHGPRHVGS